MSVSPHTTIFCESTSSLTVTCSRTDEKSVRRKAAPIVPVGERLLAAQAMRLLMCLDRDLRESRAQFNQDWFRRVMRVRSKAASRLRRRWGKIYPPPRILLGSLRRRYHANLTRYLYAPRDPQRIAL